MKKRILSLLLCCVMLLGLMPTAVFAEGSTAPADITGSGTAEDPYLIYTAAGLKAFRDKVNGQNGLTKQPGAHAKLMNDIVLNDGTFDADGNYTTGASGKAAVEWTPIGYYKNDSDRSRYAGTFDGGRHTVKGLYVKGVEYAGLFGYAMNATIKNVTVDGYITTERYSGGIAGYLSGGSVTNCFNYCTLNSESTSGGIAGFITEQCKIIGCGSAGSISGGNSGGVVGYAKNKCVIQNCYNIGAVSTYSCAGGIAGDSHNSSIIACYNTGMIIISENAYGNAYVGGIIGNAFNSGSIYFCYWLKGTARNAAGYDPEGDVFAPEKAVFAPDAKTKAEFADGTVLALLKKGETLPVFGRRDYPWEKCGYLSAAGMIVPLLKGQTGDTFPIYTAEDLETFRDMVNSGESGAHARLMNDIDLGGEAWTPIANYTGTFDGNGKTVSGLNVTGVTNAGLFASLSGSAAVKNLTVAGSVEASNTDGDAYAGGIAAQIGVYAQIIDCVNNATVKAAVNNDVDVNYTAYTGGIAGYASTGVKITGCTNNGTVKAESNMANAYTGGIAGYASGSYVSIENCLNTAELSAVASSSRYLSDGVTDPDYTESRSFAGGIVGRVRDITVTGCYNTGAVTARGTGDYPQQPNAGGMIGFADSSSATTVTNCGNTGKIAASRNESQSIAGGIVGVAAADYGTVFTISYCYSTGEVPSDHHDSWVGGIAGLISGTGTLNVSDCNWLTGSCGSCVGYNNANSVTVTRTEARSKSDFADGTVLGLLKNGDSSSLWTKNGYLDAAGMTLPLLKWQTADDHAHTYDEQKYDSTGHWMACSCGFIEQDSKTAHKEVTGICTDGIKCACGYEMHTATGWHSYPTNWSPVRPGSTHEKACTNPGCGVTKTESCTGGTATCKDKAICEICGESYGELKANNHADMKHTDAKAATKTAEGNTEYWYCEDCGKYFADKYGTKEITKADTVTAKLPDDSKSPQTGDNSNLLLWIALLFISGGAVTATTVYGRKKKRSVK